MSENPAVKYGTEEPSSIDTSPGLFSKQFAIYTGERAVKTAAQVSLAVIVSGVVGTSSGILDVGWVEVASVTGLATVLSVLTSIVTITSRNVGD